MCTFSSYVHFLQQMNEFTTMYHYFKGISDSATLNSSFKVVIEQQKTETSPITSPPSASTPTATVFTDLASPQMYLEMNSSDQDSNGSPINAVTNLNYINIENETKDNEINKNLNSVRIIEDTEIRTNQLKILEPEYFESTEINNKTDPFSQDCSNLLEKCSGGSLHISSNENSMGDYLCQPSNKPVFDQHISNENEFSDYLTQPSNKPVVMTSSADNNYLIQPSNRKVLPCDFNQSHLKFNFKHKSESQTVTTPRSNGTLRRQGSDSSKASVDDELLEIMNDFKNNVFTIQEVEQLVVSWKNRNDVQQSYKEKHDQLQHMRTEYERIQEQIKDKIKRPTPFERVRKLFSRNKSNVRVKRHDECSPYEPKSPTHRPISSLSLQSISSSSSSSGRMSTGSACSGASMGDSGTHSDHEDRRNAGQVSQVGGSIDNYLVTPRPVLADQMDPADIDETDSTVTEHYVLFPSNIPVSPTINNLSSHDYMNYSALNTIDETKETGPDTIGPTLQPIKVQNSDRFYGPTRENAADLCSSFKPTINAIEIKKAINESQFHCKNKLKLDITKASQTLDSLAITNININEIYRNINKPEIQPNDHIANLSKSIIECNSNILSSPNNVLENDSHEYMNL